MKNIIILSAIFSLLVTATPAEAQVPHLLRYQGSLSDNNGVPLEGTYLITFRLYTGQVDPMGSEIYIEPINVTCTGGVFSVLIGTGGTPGLDTLAFDQEYWLGLEVESEGEELSPRHRITSSAYAMRSAVADLALSAQSAQSVDIQAQGAGSSLDADTVDGLHAAQLLDRTAHTGIAPVGSIAQGAGSGLDSDTVDGNEASALLSRTSHTGTQTPSSISPQGDGSGLDADLFDGADSSEFFKGDIFIDSGVLYTGATIPRPAGFTDEECAWIVSFNYLSGSGNWDGDDSFVCGTGNFQVRSFAATHSYTGNTPRFVTAEHWDEDFQTKRGAGDNLHANYLIIGVKKN